MAYARYDKDIVEAHKCKIVGWIGDFRNPADIGTLPLLRQLRDGWACGATRWIRLTPSQVRAHAAEIEQQLKTGEIAAKKPRKKRSDAGKSRGGKRKSMASGKENTQPVKKVKRARNQLPPKSKEVINSDDDRTDEEEGNGSGEDGDDE